MSAYEQAEAATRTLVSLIEERTPRTPAQEQSTATVVLALATMAVAEQLKGINAELMTIADRGVR